MGFNKFKGDLILSSKLEEYQPGTIFAYTGKIKGNQLGDLKKYKQLIFPMVHVGGLYEAAHSFGYTTQVLVELEKMGVGAIAIGDGLENVCWNLRNSDRLTKISEDTSRIRDVTVECDGDNAQIYFND